MGEQKKKKRKKKKSKPALKVENVLLKQSLKILSWKLYS